MESDIEAIVNFADRHGIRLDADEAEQLISARETLAQNPDDVEAQRVDQHYRRLLYFAKDELSFADFINAHSFDCPPLCPECAERSERYRLRAIMRSENPPPIPVIERLLRLDVLRDACPQGPWHYNEKWDEFLARTGLTVERIERMSDDELKAFA